MTTEIVRVRDDAGNPCTCARVMEGRIVLYCSRYYRDGEYSGAARDVASYLLGRSDAADGREPLWYRVGRSYVSAESGHIGSPDVGAAYLAGFEAHP